MVDIFLKSPRSSELFRSNKRIAKMHLAACSKKRGEIFGEYFFRLYKRQKKDTKYFPITFPFLSPRNFFIKLHWQFWTRLRINDCGYLGFNGISILPKLQYRNHPTIRKPMEGQIYISLTNCAWSKESLHKEVKIMSMIPASNRLMKHRVALGLFTHPIVTTDI